MNFDCMRERGRLRGLRAVAVASLLAIGAGGAVLFAGNGPKLPGGGGAGGGDSVGSLPSTSSGNGAGGNHMVNGQAGGTVVTPLPEFALVGPLAELHRVVADAAGTGSVEIRPVAGTDLHEMIFHGVVTIWLDRAAFEASSVDAKLEISAAYGASSLRIAQGKRSVVHAQSPAGDVPLAIGAFSSTHALDQGTVVLTIVNAKKQKQVVGVEAGTTRIVIEQLF